ncbi:MAG: hypothetical protein IKO74_11665 [Selenomonadaceae bacterium]|nr:hypothetical protein [Selenomonadaceae bacterium]
MFKLIFKSAVIFFMLLIFLTPALAKEVVNVDPAMNIPAERLRFWHGQSTT